MRLVLINEAPCEVRVDLYKRCGMFLEPICIVAPHSRTEIDIAHGKESVVMEVTIVKNEPGIRPDAKTVVVEQGRDVGEIKLKGTTHNLCFMAFHCRNGR